MHESKSESGDIRVDHVPGERDLSPQTANADTHLDAEEELNEKTTHPSGETQPHLQNEGLNNPSEAEGTAVVSGEADEHDEGSQHVKGIPLILLVFGLC